MVIPALGPASRVRVLMGHQSPCHPNNACVFRAGWSGLSPLHQACLHGRTDLARCLLQNGADPNQPNDFGETPFHFACRNGKVMLVQDLFGFGADIEAVDHVRRTSLHHATLGGNVVALKYLEELGCCQWLALDVYSQTPLHVASGAGNDEIVHFLLQNDRSNIHLRDMKGNCALHLAALHGHGITCWMLLKAGGPELLYTRNSDGCTAVDLAKSSKCPRHMQLFRDLEDLGRSRTTLNLRYPTRLYYRLMFQPTVIVLLAFAGVSLFPAVGSVIILLAYLLLARSTFFHGHRIQHISGWPNPSYFGLVIGMFGHSIFLFSFKLLPFMWTTPSLLLSFIVVTTFNLWTLAQLMLQDPGSLQSTGGSSLRSLVESGQSDKLYCAYCELVKPANSKHCKLCGFCMMDMNHHCLFLMRCIARRNHCRFLIFLTSMLAFNLICASVAFTFLLSKAQDQMASKPAGMVPDVVPRAFNQPARPGLDFHILATGHTSQSVVYKDPTGDEPPSLGPSLLLAVYFASLMFQDPCISAMMLTHVLCFLWVGVLLYVQLDEVSLPFPQRSKRTGLKARALNLAYFLSTGRLRVLTEPYVC
uniref:Palmitoyltransferase n=1 Tax=Eptatretus burgeri TaxID=7764 RepID=A0A8C4R3F9_EPTBU